MLAVAEARRDAVTYDERLYISSGVATLVHGEIRTNPEHPPLAKVLPALAVLALQPQVPATPSWRSGDQAEYSFDFFAAQGSEAAARRIVFVARLVPVALAVATGLLCYAIGRLLWNRGGALVAAALWFLSPLVLAQGHVAALDGQLALLTVGLIGLVALHARRPSTLAALGAGVVLGGALLTKGSGFFLVPGAVAAFLVVPTLRSRRLWQRATDAAVILLVAWIAVWVGMWLVAPSPPLAAGDGTLAAPLLGLVPWPDAFRYALEYQSFYSRVPGPAFLLGRAWEGTQWWYLPGSMLVKTPAPALLVTVAGLAAWAGMPRRDVWRATAILVVPVLPFLVLTMAGPRQIGLRYYLPGLAAIAIAAGAVARPVGAWQARSPAAWRGVAAAGAVLVVAQVAWFVEAGQGSLAWTAPGFRPGYRFTTDSNIDWGQDAHQLRDFVAGKAPVHYRLLSVHFIPPGGRLLDVERLDQVRGWVVVNASSLTAYTRDELAFLRAYCPVRLLGGSYLVYRFEHPPVTAPGPTVPEPPCEDSPYSRRTA